MDNLFIELAAVMAGAGIIAFLLRFLKQPSIIAYIVTGLIIGQLGLVNIHNGEIFHGLGEIGITLLLFMVGLEMDISQLKRISKTAIITGLVQVIFTGVAGFGLLSLLGFEFVTALYISIAISFSSTIIAVKLLSEKKDLQSLYGKIVVGILLVQAVLAIFILVLLSSSNAVSGSPFAGFNLSGQLVLTLGKTFMLGVAIVWLSKYVFPRVIKSIEKSEELILLFALAWSLGIAALFSLPIIGFNAAIAGFVAGLSLANSGIQHKIGSRIQPLRDFFIIIFFIVLGASLSLTNISDAIIPALIITGFVLIIKPLITSLSLSILGYKPRIGFMSGASIAHISEFGLLITSAGLAAGYVNETDVTVVALVRILTIAAATYGILYASKIYKYVQPLFNYLDFSNTKKDNELIKSPPANHIIIIGAHRLGSHILDSLSVPAEEIVIIDFNPDVVHHYEKLGYTAICGDIADQYIQEVSNLKKARLIISTIPDLADNMATFEFIKRQKKKIKIIMTAQDEDEAQVLYDLGADYVLVQHIIGSLHLAGVIEANQNPNALKKLKERHLKSLRAHDHH
ncbi:cation:proton antiporter [bacterium]|nr:MAG: cation:proton antiporter [bacterium]